MKTSGYSNADIAAIVDEAKLIAVVNGKEDGEASERAVRKEYLLEALTMVETSITKEYLESTKKFMERYKVRK